MKQLLEQWSHRQQQELRDLLAATFPQAAQATTLAGSLGLAAAPAAGPDAAAPDDLAPDAAAPDAAAPDAAAPDAAAPDAAATDAAVPDTAAPEAAVPDAAAPEAAVPDAAAPDAAAPDAAAPDAAAPDAAAPDPAAPDPAAPAGRVDGDAAAGPLPAPAAASLQAAAALSGLAPPVSVAVAAAAHAVREARGAAPPPGAALGVAKAAAAMWGDLLDIAREEGRLDDVLESLLGQEQPAAVRSWAAELRAAPGHEPPPPAEATVVAFVTANPLDTQKLELEREVKEIRACLEASDLADRFDLVVVPGATLSDLLDTLLEHQPTIVHFAGHGDPTGGIILNDDDGDQRIVPVASLSQLFTVLKDRVRCVLLGTCFSELQAKALVTTIEAATGMRGPVHDDVARTFAVNFYRALAHGRSLRTAFDLGLVAIGLYDLGDDEVPQLYVADGVDPAQMILVASGS